MVVVEKKDKKPLDKGFCISKEETSRNVANDFVIDCNKRAPGIGKVNKAEPKFTK